MNPTLILSAVIAGLAAYFYGHHAGYAEKETEVQLEIARLNDAARTKEQELNKQITDVNNTLTEANNALEKESSALDRAIRAGRVRFPTSCVQTSSGAPAVSGSGNQAGSESDQETLRLIAQIVADGDRNTAQLNACIDQYNKVMEAVNGQR